MTDNNANDRFAEEFSTPEDVEERFEGDPSSSNTLAEPLLPSASTDHSLRHRSRTTIFSVIDEYDGDNDENINVNVSDDWRHRFQPQRQQHQHQQRILDRSGAHGQSRGRWGVERRLSRDPLRGTSSNNRNGGGDTEPRRLRRRWCSCGCGKDWFFWLAYKKTIVLFLLLFLSYGLIICFFGFIYLSLSIFGSKAEVNPDGSTKIIAFCDMDINDHMEAMYFSLSTMTTIGYGVSDYYFGGCYSPLLIVLLQICTAIVFDAVAVGLIFHRISRGASRSRSILFSDKAIVRTIKGVPNLMFRLGEQRKYHLIEATVRCYCIRHERLPNYYRGDGGRRRRNPTDTSDDVEVPASATMTGGDQDVSVRIETTPFVSRQMRLVQPDDRFGSHLWMGLPQVVVHRIDEKSPLMPSSPLWFDARGNAHAYPPQPEEEQNKRSPMTSSEESDLLGSSSCCSSNNKAIGTKTTRQNMGCLRDFLRDRDVELVVLVEGTDEGTGAATQARHSYKLCDIAWNHRFADCVSPYSRRQRSGPSSLDPVVSIDFAKFHDILPAPEDCIACAYVPDP